MYQERRKDVVGHVLHVQIILMCFCKSSEGIFTLLGKDPFEKLQNKQFVVITESVD